MKRTIALALAVSLVAVGLPSLAHEPAYPDECENRTSRDYCRGQGGKEPAHRRCTGEPDQRHNDNLVREPLGFAISEDASVTAYVHATKQATSTGSSEGAAGLMPGVVWIETNGFSDLQRTDWECKSYGHDDPHAWEVHADQVLI